MSKFVKDLVTDHLKHRLTGVDEALLVNLTGIDANTNHRLRRELREKDISLMVIKNSLARRAAEGTALAPAFEGLAGPSALVWGGEDIVALAKEVIRFTKDRDFEPLEARGGIMEGEALTGEEVVAISKWPSRSEQLSILVGQMLNPGGALASQLNSVGESLASQIEQRADSDGADSEGAESNDTAGSSAEAAGDSADAAEGSADAAEGSAETATDS